MGGGGCQCVCVRGVVLCVRKGEEGRGVCGHGSVYVSMGEGIVGEVHVSVHMRVWVWVFVCMFQSFPIFSNLFKSI